MTETRSYEGQCHCGAVRFTVRTDLGGVADCNCSRCRRLGWIMQPVPAADFTLHAGTEALAEYRFNTDRIEHLFCRHCGIESFARGPDGQGGGMVVVNVNCLEGAPEIDRARVKHWDGRNF